MGHVSVCYPEIGAYVELIALHGFIFCISGFRRTASAGASTKQQLNVVVRYLSEKQRVLFE